MNMYAFNRCVIILGVFSLSGCVSLLQKKDNAEYAYLYIRTVDAVTGTSISASAVSACDGLSLGDTLVQIPLVADRYWKRGKVISIVSYAPGYVPTWQIATIDKWFVKQEDARLNSNIIYLQMQPEKLKLGSL